MKKPTAAAAGGGSQYQPLDNAAGGMTGGYFQSSGKPPGVTSPSSSKAAPPAGLNNSSVAQQNASPGKNSNTPNALNKGNNNNNNMNHNDNQHEADVNGASSGEGGVTLTDALRLDAEAFQQRAYELFDQYTSGTTVHKLDLLDMLEDLGFVGIGMGQLQEAVINDLGLGATDGGKGGKQSKKGEGLQKGAGKIPSSFDLDDTMAICMHFYNKEDSERKGTDDDANHQEVIDIQAHSFLYLLITCTRNPRVQYNIIRPAFLNFKFTPKKMLISGAASVMCLMCVLVLLTLALLWMQNVKQDEQKNAENYASTFSKFMDQYEYRDGEPLRQAIEAAELLGSVHVAAYSQELLDEEKNLDHAAAMMAGSAAVGFRIDLKEKERVLAGMKSALKTGYSVLKAMRGGVGVVLEEGEISSEMPLGLYRNIILPMLTRHVTVSAVLEGWDFVAVNTSLGRAINDPALNPLNTPPHILTPPSILCSSCEFRNDPCATFNNADVYASLSASRETADGFVATSQQEDLILERIDINGTLTSSGVNVVSISTHMPALGLTVCFFKPRTRFVQRAKNEIGGYFMDKYSGVFAQMRFQVGHNLVRYDRSTEATDADHLGRMSHLTPLDIFGSIRVNCVDGHGCENGNIRAMVAKAVNACNKTQQCEIVSTTLDGVDDSSTPVVCAARSFGFPLATDSAIILCRSRADIQALSTQTLIKAADASNLKHADMKKNTTASSSVVVATRNATTGAIRPQANAFTISHDCRGGTNGKQCVRTTPSAAAATQAFNAGRAAAARYMSSFALLQTAPAATGHATNIAPDYRLHVPVFQGYVYLPMLDLVIGSEREVMRARTDAAQSILDLSMDVNSQADSMAVVPVTRYVNFEPTRHYDPKEVCPVGIVCLDRAGFGVTYRSDCRDCSETGHYGRVHSLVPLPHCHDAADNFTCTDTIASSSIYRKPFIYQAGGVGGVEDGDSYYGETSLYAPIYVRNISLGIVLHFYTSQRRSEAFQGIYIAIGVSLGLIVIALTVFLLLSQNNLNQVQKEWVQYKKQISRQKSDFARVVGDVVPPVYAPLLFVRTSQIAERLNITTIFVNFVGFQRHISEQDADFVHDYTSYSFYAINTITRFYRMFKVKTFGDNFMIVGGVNKQMNTRGAAIRKMVNGDGSVIAATMSTDEKQSIDDNEDASIVRCVESACVLMQLFSYLFQHNPQHIGFLRKRLKAKQLLDMTMLRIGIATGPTNLIMTRHDGFPFFLALSEHAAVAYKLQQAAKSNSINVSSEVKKAIIRFGKEDAYEFGKDRTLLHKKIVVTSSIIQKADVPIPPVLQNALKVSRAPCRMFFTEDGVLKAAVAGAVNAGTGASTQQMGSSEKGSVHSGMGGGGMSSAMSNALRRMTGNK